METNRTDKEILVKGIKLMALTALLMFLGPTLLYIGLGNEESSLYMVTVIVGGLLCVGAIYCGFKGIKTVMKSMFK
ncbi:DUF6095 family protein [Winogradskyella sp. 3972H.M.0a.05]|uniref:DUF6095 family protein n=1 Tax=Winogradskyella sp. 3972H.M.0a.05 TaxID=2950277 RepID=UPI0033969DEA